MNKGIKESMVKCGGIKPATTTPRPNITPGGRIPDLKIEKMPRVGTAVLIFNNKGHVLLSKRLNGENPGQWCPPGGKLDFGEYVKDGMEREVLEETALKVDAQLLPLTTQNMTDHGNHYVCFWGHAYIDTDDHTLTYVEYKDGKPKIDGYWHFIDPRNALELPLFGSVPVALSYYLNSINGYNGVFPFMFLA